VATAIAAGGAVGPSSSARGQSDRLRRRTESEAWQRQWSTFFEQQPQQQKPQSGSSRAWGDASGVAGMPGNWRRKDPSDEQTQIHRMKILGTSSSRSAARRWQQNLASSKKPTKTETRNKTT
jgi:hypothetical protein